VGDGFAHLHQILEDGRAVGYLGPAAIEVQIAHARAMGRAIDDWSGSALDLGSGGGLPGLVLAMSHPHGRWVLLDAHAGRTSFLEQAVRELALSRRVAVVRARAEEAGRRSDLREAFAVVTARGFGRPAVTAECASALAAVGGRVVVSEPPDAAPDRWSATGLERLGLRRGGILVDGAAHVLVLEKVEPCPEWVPRATGRPAKRPLF
jgi:16S rRNA (guanine527-N7)-methyltransferase